MKYIFAIVCLIMVQAAIASSVSPYFNQVHQRGGLGRWIDSSGRFEIRVGRDFEVIVSDRSKPTTEISRLKLPEIKTKEPIDFPPEVSVYFANDLLMHVMRYRVREDGSTVFYDLQRQVSFFVLKNGTFQPVKCDRDLAVYIDFEAAQRTVLLKNGLIFAESRYTPHKQCALCEQGHYSNGTYQYDPVRNEIIHSRRERFYSQEANLNSWTIQFQLDMPNEVINQIQYKYTGELEGLHEGFAISRQFWLYPSKGHDRIMDAKTGQTQELTPAQSQRVKEIFREKYWAPIQDNWIIYTPVGEERTPKAVLCNLDFASETICSKTQEVQTYYYYPWELNIGEGYLKLP